MSETEALIPDPDETPCKLKSSKDVRSCIKTLNSNPKGNGMSGSASVMEGFLLRKSSSDGTYNPFWVVLDPESGYLTCYKSQAATKVDRKIKVSFIRSHVMNVKDSLAIEQMESNSPWSRNRLSVYGNKKYFMFASEEDEEFEPWISASQDFLAANFSDEELKEKKNAFASLQPMLEDQDETQIKQYAQLRKVLANSMVLNESKRAKLKQGNLSMQSKDGNWKEIYVVLHTKFVAGHRLKDKTMPAWVTCLKYIVDLSQEGNLFHVVTPLVTLHFQAKHNAAAEEWCNAIQLAILDKKPTDKTKVQESQEVFDAPSVDRPVLSYDAPGLFGKRKKKYTIKSEIVTIGRASSNTLSFGDNKQSRNHAKIEVRDGSAPVLIDLGSTYGTTVNDQPITKHPLRVGDKIVVGTTTITLECLYFNFFLIFVHQLLTHRSASN